VTTVRKFKIPPLNFTGKSTDYLKMIKLKEQIFTVPPISRYISDNDLIDYMNKTEKITFSFPCHTQAVERGVKLITEASISVSGHIERDGFIRDRL